MNIDETRSNLEINSLSKIGSSQSTGSVLLNMNYNASNSYLEYPISIVKGNIYNITLESTGSAIFDVSLVFDAASIDYVSQVSSTVWKDEFLTSCGVPLWGTYNAWDSFTFSSVAYKGISLIVSTPKSFLIYLDPKFSGISFNCSFLIIFRSTSNTADNYISIDWTTIDFSNPDMDIEYSDENALYAEAILPSSFSTINFSTVDNKDLTEVVLNETLSVDNSLYLIRWVRDLSGNLVRKTNLLSGISNSIYCPKIMNQIINGTDSLVGIALNINPLNTVTFNWKFTTITDSTLNYAELNATGTDQQNTIRFRPGYYNQAWRLLKIENNTQYFDIEFVDKSGYNQLYWDIQVQFYLIGNTTTPLVLNTFGDNVSEKIHIFTTKQTSDYTSTTESFIKRSNGNYQYWLARYGIVNPNPANYAGTENLGIVITAVPSVYLLDLNCTIDFTFHDIETLINDDPIFMGHQNGFAYGEFDIFQVRKFNFKNYDQYKWSLLSENATVLNTISDLRCNDPNNDRYPKGLNNALISIPINTLSLTGSLYLTYKISTVLQPNDYLYVYIKNSTAQSLIYTYSGTNATNTPNFRITRHADSNLQIIFNLTTDDTMMGAMGPIIDDISINNVSHTVFSDNFEYTFNKWTQVDNTGGTNKYWRVERVGVTYNSPLLKIVYPNHIYTMAGNDADPWLYSDLYKQALNYNPYVQTQEGSISTAYIVILPNSNLVQNFTVQIRQEVYHSNAINNGEIVTANYAYNLIVFSDGINQYQEVQIDEFYQYFYIKLDPAYRYDLTFIVESSSLITIDTSIFSEVGIDWVKNMNNYYGFFMINHTYTIRPARSETIYFKFDAIAYGTEFTINVVQTAIWTEFPWMPLIIGILAALNVLSLAWLIKTKKDQNQNKEDDSKKDRNEKLIDSSLDAQNTTAKSDNFKF